MPETSAFGDECKRLQPFRSFLRTTQRSKQWPLSRRSNLLHIAAQLIVDAERREITALDALGPDEDAAIRCAAEVPCAALDAAVILARRLIQSDAYPGRTGWASRDFWDRADKGYGSSTGVGRFGQKSAATVYGDAFRAPDTSVCSKLCRGSSRNLQTPLKRGVAERWMRYHGPWIFDGNVPLSPISLSINLIFCSSTLGACGSKRPNFCALFHASTLSVRDSYCSAGMVYFSTLLTSV